MPYRSVDIDRLQAIQGVIDASATGAQDRAANMRNIGGSVAKGISKGMGNRADKIAAEAKQRAEMEATLDELEYFNRQLIAAGQDNSQVQRRIEQLRQRLGQSAPIDLSAPTPTSPAIKAGGLTAQQSGPLNI